MDNKQLLTRVQSLLLLIIGGAFHGKWPKVREDALALAQWIRLQDNWSKPPLEQITSKADVARLPKVTDLEIPYEQPTSYYCGSLGVMTALEMREFLLANLDNLDIASQVHAYPAAFGTTLLEDAALTRGIPPEELQKVLKNVAIQQKKTKN